MTPYDKRTRWPFLAEDKTIHVEASKGRAWSADADPNADGRVTILDEPTLMPEHFRRLSISDSMPLEAYAPKGAEE